MQGAHRLAPSDLARKTSSLQSASRATYSGRQVYRCALCVKNIAAYETTAYPSNLRSRIHNASVDRFSDECCMSASHNSSATTAGSHMRKRALKLSLHLSRDLQGAQISETPHAVPSLQDRTFADS